MKPMDFTFEADMPEQPNLTFVSSGSKGGDAGHGGGAFIRLSMPHGGNGFAINAVTDMDELDFDEVREVSIDVMGDWELEGLAIAFLELGRALLARDDVLKAREKWSQSNDDL